MGLGIKPGEEVLAKGTAKGGTTECPQDYEVIVTKNYVYVDGEDTDKLEQLEDGTFVLGGFAYANAEEVLQYILLDTPWK